MGGILKFDVDKVSEELNRVQGAKGWQEFYGEKTGAGLFLVGDQGVYLMGNHEREDKPPYEVIYADGIDPTKDDFDTWYNAKVDIFGGDDGVEFISLNEAVALVKLARSRNHKWFCVHLTQNSMKYTTE